MKLPRTANTALLLAAMLAEGYRKEQTSLAFISKKHGVSVLFLKKLARALKQSGIVTSKEGLGGGYMLARHPSRISVWEILEAVELVDKKNSTSVNTACPINKYCLPQTIQKTIDMSLKKHLSAVTLEDLL
jgi:Rrf2 family protein